MTEPRGSGLSWSVISSMEVTVGGLNITTHCDIKRSVFEMHAGPLPGTAKVYVRDLGHDLSFVTGAEITLDIEDLRVWGGYVMSITREFAFPVDDTSDPASTPRYFVLDCSDYNLLFSKRFIRNKADATARVPKYPAGMHDDQIILDLIENYLDLEGDGLTHTKVKYVGTPQEDNPGSPAVPAMSWATAMRNVALMPGAIYYIDADKDLAYADVDVADAPFALSDNPDGVTSFGYRNMSIIEDGTMLANDAFVWGTGLGQDAMTFRRYEDASSQSEHGLWQWADYRQDLYRPQSVLKRATTYVDGSTQNNRGHKDPAVTIRATTFKPGLRAGMKVRFICETHGYSDVIPVRSMHIRFVNSFQAVYELVLAHYLDEAWNTAEFPPLREDPPVDTRHCEQPSCVATDIADTWDRTSGTTPGTVYDSFTRTVSSGLGMASNGNYWDVNEGDGSWSVNGSAALPSVTANQDAYARLVIAGADDVTVEAQLTSGSASSEECNFGVSNLSYSQYAYLRLTRGGAVTFYGSMNNFFLTTTVGFGAATKYKSRIKITSTAAYGKVWASTDPEPVAWTLTANYSSRTISLTRASIGIYSRNGTSYTGWFDNLAGPDTVAYGWGLSDSGIAWSDTGTSSGVALIVDETGSLETAPASQPYNSSSQQLATTLPTFFDGTVQFLTNHTAGDIPLPNPGGQTDYYPAGFSINSSNGLYVSSVSVKHRKIATGDTSTYLEFAISLPMTFDPQTCPITVTSNTWYNLRFSTSVGSLLKAKIWAVGDSEPIGWVVSTLTAPSATYTEVVLSHSTISQTFTSGSANLITKFDNLLVLGDPLCTLTHSYNPGSLTATSLDGDAITIIEIDPEAGTFSYAPSAEDIIVCYLEEGTDTPPGGYVGGPVYRPRHVRQLGWGSSLDGSNCTMASACIALDRHTMGAKTATPPEMRSHQLDQSGGTDLGDAAYAWLHGYGEHLNVSWGTSWASFVSMIQGGRGGILQGVYSHITGSYSAQPSFDGGHAMYVNEFNESGEALVYDPLATAPQWMPAAMLQDYAEAFAGGSCNAAYTQVTS